MKKLIRELRWWLLVKLAGESTVVINANFDTKEDGCLVVYGDWSVVSYNTFRWSEQDNFIAKFPFWEAE